MATKENLHRLLKTSDADYLKILPCPLAMPCGKGVEFTENAFHA